MKLLMIIVMFFLIGAFFIISENNLAFIEKGNIDEFFSLYFSWLDTLGKNTGQVTGYVVNLEWLPE
jgi:ABC-type multidrug transport system permease subunit